MNLGFFILVEPMKLIRKTGTIRDKKGRCISHGDFKCGICGKIVNKSLTHGNRQISCGCKWSSYKHGMKNTRLHKVWVKMKERCYNGNNPCHKYWYGKGVVVCDEWQEFIPFKDWALANGYSDDLQIDRIDGDGNYTPDNCRFVTQKENSRNRAGYVKMSMGKANEVRRLYSSGGHSQRELAKIYDYSQVGIWNIIHNKIWT